jgi:hypothetical protein
MIWTAIGGVGVTPWNAGEAAHHKRRPEGRQLSFTAVPEALTISILSPTVS